MSYENLRSTKMLATNCAVCGRPLRDAVSVEMGIGPDCRAKYGYNDCVNDENRMAANRLIFQIADLQTGIDAVECARQLRNLGFAKLSAKIATRLFSVRITREGDKFVVSTPYTEAAVAAFRAVPGRKWNKEASANEVPVSYKSQLWAALKKAFPGQEALGPDGQFISIPA
jgi:hypothetical protein